MSGSTAGNDAQEKVVVLVPTLTDERAERVRKRVRGAKLYVLPPAVSDDPRWVDSVIDDLKAFESILAVELSHELDPDAVYRSQLGRIFAEATPELRRRWLPCHIGSDGPEVPGSRGRSLGDLESEQANALLKIATSGMPEGSFAAATDGVRLILHDRPVLEDAIGFQTAARVLADLLSNAATRPPVVAAIEGGWGAGKSSFMNLVRQELRARAPSHTAPNGAAVAGDPATIRTVWFNAWASDGEGAAFSGLALSLLEALAPRGETRFGPRVRLAFRRFRDGIAWQDAFRLVGGAITLVVGVVVTILMATPAGNAFLGRGLDWLRASIGALSAVVGIVGIKSLWTFFGSPLKFDLTKHLAGPDHRGQRATGERLYDDIAHIIDVYTKGVERLYVFIDDLDRADPAKVSDVIQAISVILAKASSKLVYVLALDREKVAAAIAARHKEVATLLAAPGATPVEFGHSYLEKLIQVSFRVPSPDAEALGRWIERLIDAKDGRSDVARVVRLLSPRLASNPRRIKQFVNLLNLRLMLLTDEVKLSAVQLGKLTAAEILFPQFIGDLARDPGLLNELLLGTGRASRSYALWSSKTELLELLTLRPNAPAATAMEILAQDRNASLLDIDVEPILRLAARVGVVAPTVGSPAESVDVAVEATPYESLRRYGKEYERIRVAQRFSPQRTATLDRLFDDMAIVGAISAQEALGLLESGEPGDRIAALASCLRSGHGAAGEIVSRILVRPKSKFETFHALRAAKLIGPQIDEAHRRAIARLVSQRWLTDTDRHDGPIWALTRDVLLSMEAVGPGEDIQITLLDGTPVWIPFDDKMTFNELTEVVFHTMLKQVRPYHYGYDWRFVVGDKPLRHMREIEKRGPGVAVPDPRLLPDFEITRGSMLRIERVTPGAARSPRDDGPQIDLS